MEMKYRLSCCLPIVLKDIDAVSSLENYDQIAYLPGC